MKRSLLCSLIAGAAMVAAATAVHSPASAQASEPFLGQSILVGFLFCPKNWVEADGRLLSIAQNTALFSLYGTSFGGNGLTTFGIPDLRGRIPLGQGQGPGLPYMELGEALGAPSNTLITGEMPVHTHMLNASSQSPASSNPTNDWLATFPSSQNIYAPNPVLNQALSPAAVASTGQGLPFPKYQPTLTLRYCIATQGIYPSRS